MHYEAILLIAKGKLYKAPIKNPRTMLDLGTGTGIWSIDRFRSSRGRGYGLDLR